MQFCVSHTLMLTNNSYLHLGPWQLIYTRLILVKLGKTMIWKTNLLIQLFIQKKNFYYAKKEDNIIFNSFVGIKFFFICYQDIFSSKSLLHKYLKTCKISNLTCSTLTTTVQSLILVVESDILITGFKTRFEFKS